MPRMVHCVKLGRELPGLGKAALSRPARPAHLRKRFGRGYSLWQPHMTILINHYGLNPADPETRRILREQMEEFFFGQDAAMPEGWVPPEQAAPAKGAPRKK